LRASCQQLDSESDKEKQPPARATPQGEEDQELWLSESCPNLL
jgi:hypothetical protein